MATPLPVTPPPATPAPANPYNVTFNPHGAGIKRVTANADAQAYFNQQSAEDQAKIRASWGGRPDGYLGGSPTSRMLRNNYDNSYMNQWYTNAQNAGSPVPVTPPAAPAAPKRGAADYLAAPQPYQPPQPNGQPANGYQPSQPSGHGPLTVPAAAVGTIANMMTTNYQPPAAPAAPRNIGQEYEAWKAGGRQGPRPEGT